VLARCTLISTLLTPLDASEAVPQMSPVVAVPQPALYVVLLYLVAATGKVVALVGGVPAMLQVRVAAAPVLPAPSTAWTSNVCDPSASAPHARPGYDVAIRGERPGWLPADDLLGALLRLQ
jgi:hypothetical protein